MKKLLSILGFAVVLVGMMIGGGLGKLIGPEVAKSISGSSKVSQKNLESVLIEGFQVGAKKANIGLPMMIDDETRLDQATVGPGPRMVYHNTFVNYRSNEVDEEWVQTSLRIHVQTNVCANADMKSSLQYGGIYVYAYYGNDGQKIGDFEIDRNHCGLSARIP